MIAGGASGVTAVAVQTILYRHPAQVVTRLVGAANAAAHLAPSHTVSLYIGDCGPEPLSEPPGPTDALRRVVYRHFGANLGHGRAQNALASGHDASVIVLLNPDAYPAPSSLRRLCAALGAPGVGMAEGRQLPMESPKLASRRDGATPWAAGAYVALRREAFEAAGRFDPAFFLHDDDVDLSWRVRRAGFAIRYVPDAVAFHHREIDPSGYAASNPVEASMMALGEMLLLHRAGRPEDADNLAASAGTPHQQLAAEHYRRQSSEKALPRPFASVTASGVLLDRGLRRF